MNEEAESILVVDDEQSITDFVSYSLMKEGFKVDVASNGEEGLRAAMHKHYDLFVLDIMLPGMDGYELCRRLRSKTNAPVLFLSARDTELDKVVGLEIGGDDYLAKPFYPEELIARIHERFTSQLSDTVEEETYRFGHSVFNYSTNEIRTGNNKVLITSRQAEILRLLAKNLNLAVDRDLLLNTVWSSASYANSLALNVQITYLRKALRNDPSVKIESLMKKGYILSFNDCNGR